MQLVSTVTISPDELIARHESEAPYTRSRGLHLSDIYKSICVEMDRKRFDPDKPMDTVRIEAGSAFETILEQGLALRHSGLLRPGEIECDGVTGSPDGIDIEHDPWRLLEYKATWMSSRDGIGTVDGAGQFTPHRKFWHWFVQMKGYLYMLNAGHGLDMREAQLVAFFANGDYSKGMGGTGPQLLSWVFMFSDGDLLRNWAMLIQHARRKGMFDVS